MKIQISWLFQKPTDLDLHCLLRQGMSCSAREGLSSVAFHRMVNNLAEVIHMGALTLVMLNKLKCHAHL